MNRIPKRLRQAIRLRARAYHKLRDAYLQGGGADVFVHALRVSELNRFIQRREWLEQVEGFDPIALGC